MSISKKLSLIATLGLNLATFNASAYDVVGLKKEVQLISEFAQNSANDMYVEYNNEKRSLEYWLQSKIYHTYTTSDYKIIEIANIIKQSNIDQLVRMMENELRWNKLENDIVTGIFLVVGTCITLEMVSKIINMTIDHRIFHKTFSSQIETLVTLDKMQQQINNLSQKVNQTLFEKFCDKVFAK
ncbi:MAG TPA: hypothetical protein VHX42_00740 [Candidatus Babeliales bacterium]|jgi:hypothetical protein|nr:hypothetical protein [Candidatus Babeliales bacterium]